MQVLWDVGQTLTKLKDPSFFNNANSEPGDGLIKMAHPKPKLIYGTDTIVDLRTEVFEDILDTLEKHNVKDLDTAYVYV